MHESLWHTGAVELARVVRARDISALEVVDGALARIDAHNPALNAFTQVDPEAARSQARDLDRRLSAGEDPGSLAGVPVGIKDLEDAVGFRTTLGDPAYAAGPTVPHDSVQVARLRAAGAIVVGKTNTPAHGQRAETESLLLGAARNPWSADHTPGGSSGGSAAAIAAGMVPLCTGSDGGGSIRIPSAACGIAGFKPTHNVVPTGDTAAPTWGPFSTRGPMARTFAEIAAALDVVKGVSPRDLMSVDVRGSFTDAVASESSAGLRIGWSPDLGYVRGADPAVRDRAEAGVRVLESLGAHVEELTGVFPESPLAGWVPRAAAGSWQRFRDSPIPWSERFDEASAVLARFGEHVTADQLVDAEAAAHAAGLRLAAVWERFDLLATPGFAVPPPRVGEPSPYGPGWAADFTFPFNLVRAPAAVVPVGFVEVDGTSLPVALQLAGPRLADLRVIEVAAALEQAMGLAARRPPAYA